MARCMASSESRRKYPNEGQRYKVCQGLWNNRNRAEAMHMTDEIIVWAGTPESAREYLERTQLWKDYEVNGLPESVRMLALSGRDEEDEDERFGAYAPFIRTVENTAVIPINGSLHSKENFFTQFFGIMTYETLSNIMALLAGDEDIKNALLSFSTPGGSAMGIDVATDAIHAMRRLGKPVYGHTADHSLSAGYWIASACETFNCQKNAEIGSVHFLDPLDGTPQQIVDRFETLAAAGTLFGNHEHLAFGLIE